MNKLLKIIWVGSLLFSGIQKGLANDGVLYEYDKKKFSLKDLDIKAKQKIFDIESQRHENLKNTLKDSVIELYVNEIAKKKNKPKEDVLKELLAVKEPTDKELKEFYEKNKSRIPYKFEQIKKEIVRFVKQKKAVEAKDKLLKEITKKKNLKFVLNPPIAPIVNIDIADFQSRGNKKAKVTVVEFADYKCPHCKEAAKIFKNIYSKYDKSVQFVFADYSIMKDSFKIAEAAFCAGKQGKYWEFHEKAFEDQEKLNDAHVVEIAKKLGVKEPSFKKCIKDREGKKIVDKGLAEGNKVGVTATPTIFINGKKINVEMTEAAISKAIDSALSSSH